MNVKLVVLAVHMQLVKTQKVVIYVIVILAMLTLCLMANCAQVKIISQFVSANLNCEKSNYKSKNWGQKQTLLLKK
jgi:hypothetical protein